MAKNVFILGAGASAEFGAPVMSNFLDIASNLLASGTINNHKESFERVFSALSRLQAVHSKSEFNLVNIESVFTAFEMAKTLGRLPGHTPDEINQLVDDLKWVIVSTLQMSVKFLIRGSRPSSDIALRDFVKILKNDRGNLHNRSDIAILTFNYDLLMDLAIMEEGIGIDYALGSEMGKDTTWPLLKLHGSLNWGTDSESNKVVPWFLSDYLSHCKISPATNVRMPIADQFSDYGKVMSSSRKLDSVPVIVPPSWNKADSHRSISQVWIRAAKELSTASSIFVIGYSLPETDSFFRQLYALGTVGDTLLKRFWVFNPDGSREEVFKSMLGPGARMRYKFFRETFLESIPDIEKAIRVG